MLVRLCFYECGRGEITDNQNRKIHVIIAKLSLFLTDTTILFNNLYLFCSKFKIVNRTQWEKYFALVYVQKNVRNLENNYKIILFFAKIT